MAVSSLPPREVAIRDLQRAIANGQAVAFVGSGVSQAATDNDAIVTWSGLLHDGISWCDDMVPTPDGWKDDVLARLDKSGTASELITIATEISELLGAPFEGEYGAWLKERFGALKPVNSGVIAAIRALDIPIVTTNYDTLIEDVTGLPSVTWRDLSEVQDVFRRNKDAVVHIHGVWNRPDTVVLGIESYNDVITEVKVYEFLRLLASQYTLLFIGMGDGLTDPNFSKLRIWIAETLKSSQYRHYRLTRDEEVRRLRTEHHKVDRIHVLGFGDNYDSLIPFLRRISPEKASSQDIRVLFGHRDEEWYDASIVQQLDDLLSPASLDSGQLLETQEERAIRRDQIAQLESTLLATRQPRAGDRIVGVDLQTQIGSGSFAEIWLGFDTISGLKKAVKIFSHVKFRMHQAMRQFRHGVDVLARLNATAGRPSTIIQMHRTDKSRLAFSMDFIDGGDLSSLPPRERDWTFETRMSVFLDICNAIRFAHDNGVIHRDLKPANILISPNNIPVVADFDIAEHNISSTILATQSVGTFRYSAPEQLDGGAASPTADIYSLGRILQYLLSDRDPPSFTEPVPLLRELESSPKYLLEAIRRCTMWSPEKRFQTVGDLLNFLELGASTVTVRQSLPELPTGMEATETPNLFIWKVPSHRSLSIEMVYIPPGVFLMGSMNGAEHEQPIHMRAMEEGYFIGKYPVTWSQYKVFYTSAKRGSRKLLSKLSAEDNNPAVQLNWRDAQAFCDWADLSLPTEAQWEKAARGTNGSIYPWGDRSTDPNLSNWNNHPVYKGNSSSPVDAFPDGASPFGLMDVAGNVWQLCQDLFSKDAYEKYILGEGTATASDTNDAPVVSRGGSFAHGVDIMRCSFRLPLSQHYVAHDVGFRVVKNL